eukprot:TRINITY_DN13113_c0_g1_i1.p1 TRINITY_DN13113_c0_g1~~TRINITY_DN13113_c0_g1_i1.p1  ORF type:complete len:161 (-),score=20.70 TRINITY_DN13113_c0_g1_i1:303-785(-)
MALPEPTEAPTEAGPQLPQITYFLFVTYDATLYPLHHIEECRQREVVENAQLNLVVKTSARVHDQQKHAKLIEQLLLETPEWTPQNSFVVTLIRDGNVNEYKGSKIICEQHKLPNQVLLNVEALRDKSLHIRNIMKQVICKATGGDPDDNFGRCHSFLQQ